MGNLESIRYFASEGFLSVFAIALLILNFLRHKVVSKPSFNYIAGIIGLVLTLIVEIYTNAGRSAEVTVFNGMLKLDSLSYLFKILCISSSILLILFSYISRETSDSMRKPMEYVFLILSGTLGMMLLVSSSNLLMMYLSLEFLSLSSYMLTGFTDKNEKASEAAMKYLLYGGTASGIMAYGLSLLYGITGTLDYSGIHTFVAGNNVGIILPISMMLIFTGMGFKIAAFPFHAWCPDVYEGALTPFSAFLSVGSKAAGFAVIIRFFYQIFTVRGEGDILTVLGSADWPFMLAILSAITMTFGNLAALRQKNIKRLLAYSSIAHAGYALMAVASQTVFGAVSVFFYLSVYFLMNFGAFLVVIVVSNEFNSEEIEDYEGLVWKNSRGAFLASMFAVFLLSLTGVPPFAGFIGKLYLLLSILQKDNPIYWLAVVALINTVISFYYYARILKAMFLSRRQKGTALSGLERGQYLQYSLITGLALFTIIFGIYWIPLNNLSMLLASFIH
jgi:NADH-quinone oxidoreductase subunit N